MMPCLQLPTGGELIADMLLLASVIVGTLVVLE